jgi:hypothetical protein
LTGDGGPETETCTSEKEAWLRLRWAVLQLCSPVVVLDLVRASRILGYTELIHSAPSHYTKLFFNQV